MHKNIVMCNVLSRITRGVAQQTTAPAVESANYAAADGERSDTK